MIDYVNISVDKKTPEQNFSSMKAWSDNATEYIQYLENRIVNLENQLKEAKKS